MRPIGYYVHHHGEGHRQRAVAVAALAPDRFMLLGTGLGVRAKNITTVDLPDDRLMTDGAFDGDDGEQERPRALHYAPLNHENVRARMTTVTRWIADRRPALLVVDVSVEVAMLARLCATPVAYVRLGGCRDDDPHIEAFRGAGILIAPFAEALDDPNVPAWITKKTIYAPGIVPRRVTALPQSGTVLVVCGRGGSSLSKANIIAAAQATPQNQWHVIGMTSDVANRPPNLTIAGWSEEPEIEIAQADIVVGAAGDGLVGAVLAARRPFVCIPEPRPFDEQNYKAAALNRAGAAIVVARWPEAAQWRGILDAARALDPQMQARLDDPNGAERLARALIDLADRQK